MEEMNRNKVLTVVRVTLGLVCWFLVYKLYGVFADPLLAGVLPSVIRMILASMVVPYTLGLGAFCLVTLGMHRESVSAQADTKPGIGMILKYFVIQTGLSFPVMVVINAVLTVAGVKSNAITADELFGNFWFYIVLLLIFNPVFEELLFRKMVMSRLSCLGTKGAIICSAVLFALPHVYSQGVAQMFFTFALGLVWGYITIKTGKLWPAIILHSLSNIYCAYVPLIAAKIHPALSIVFVMVTLSVMIPLTIVFMRKEVRAASK